MPPFVQILAHLWHLGYSPEDIIGNIFRVCKTFQMAEYLKLEFIKVSESIARPLSSRVRDTVVFLGLLTSGHQKDARRASPTTAEVGGRLSGGWEFA